MSQLKSLRCEIFIARAIKHGPGRGRGFRKLHVISVRKLLGESIESRQHGRPYLLNLVAAAVGPDSEINKRVFNDLKTNPVVRQADMKIEIFGLPERLSVPAYLPDDVALIGPSRRKQRTLEAKPQEVSSLSDAMQTQNTF